MDDVLKDIFSYATKFVFLTISTKPAHKDLPNGENAHCTIKNEGWWREKLNEHCNGIIYKVKF